VRNLIFNLIIFESSAFRNEATLFEFESKYYAQMIGPCSVQIWYSSVHAPRRSVWKLLPLKSDNTNLLNHR